tara:strand:- start:4228 stop:4701 length:474 start_codon:yes stop_codon:yes gene_type:complete
MANQGVRGFYQLTTNIRDELLTDVNINTVTTGDITEIDLSKQTIFPLAHLVVNNVTHEEQLLRFNCSVFTMDTVDESKDETSDIFLGNDNEHDVLNTMLAVQNKLLQTLRYGNLYTTKYQLEGNPSCEPFKDRFENLLAGWVSTFDVTIENDVNICD